jgi:choline dehydrogenase
MSGEAFDYVIVGGGSAGSLLACRLAEAGASVCVLEAGPKDTNPYIHIPAGFTKTLFDPKVTWRWQTEPSAGTAGRRIDTPQGRTLGGSSSINGMVFIRGQSADYDVWRQKGNRGWSYAEVLPYFKRLEKRIGWADETYRGRDGALPITDVDWHHRLCEAFIAGAAGLGYPRNPDYNGATRAGVGYYQRTIYRGRRVSAARAFLHPAAAATGRIAIRTNAQASAIMLDGNRAVGVRYSLGRGDGTPREVRANREVIVSAGTVNSPKLLQLSGIGPADLLRDRGIEVRHMLAGVGENLADHYSPRLVARAKNTGTINNLVHGPRLWAEVAKWLLRRPSVLALSAAIVYAFGKSDPAMEAPDYTVIFTPGSYRAGMLGTLDTFPGMTAGAWQMRPESKGYVRIRSADPGEMPEIQPNYLAAETDRRILLAAIRAARGILATPEVALYYDSEELPGAAVTTDDELLDWARNFGSSCYHLMGTCRMGPAHDPTAVVDDQLRVRGIERLRIADASIMPTMTSANLYATTLMIGEKAADFILGRPALAAVELPAG